MFYVLWRSSTSLIAAREILLYCNFVASAISKQDSTAHPNELVLAGEFVIKKKKKKWYAYDTTFMGLPSCFVDEFCFTRLVWTFT